MDWSVIQTRWLEFRASAKRRWDKLSEDQIRGTQGRRDYLVLRVKEAYSLTGAQAEVQVTDWQSQQVDRRKPAANT